MNEGRNRNTNLSGKNVHFIKLSYSESFRVRKKKKKNLEEKKKTVRCSFSIDSTCCYFKDMI